MRMRNVIVVVFGLLGACGGGGDPAADERAIAALIPAEAVVCVRLASVDAVATGLGEVANKGGFNTAKVTSEALLANLGAIGIDGKLVASDRALGFALVAKRATPPQPLFVLPAKDPARLHRSFTDRGTAAEVHGDYVVVALTGKYEKPAAPSPLAAALPKNLVVARVAVDRLWTNLGVMIQSGLDLGRAAMKQQAPKTPGVDMEAMFDAYFAAARTVLTAGESCELRLDLSAVRAEMSASYVAKSGGELDGWSSAPVDLAPFAGTMSAQGMGDMLMVVDWEKLWPRFEGYVDALLPMYAETARPAMRKLMLSYRDAYVAMGPVLSGSFDLGSKGIGGQVCMAPKDGKELLAKMTAIGGDPALADVGYTFSAEPLREAGGVVQQDLRVKVDFDKLLAKTPAGAGQAEARAQAKAMMDRMLGKDGLRFGYAAQAGRAVAVLGESAIEPAALLAQVGGTWPAAVQPGLAFMAGCNPQMLMRLDMAGMGRFVGGLTGEPAPSTNGPANFVIGAGVKERDWRFLLQFDLGFLQAMGKR